MVAWPNVAKLKILLVEDNRADIELVKLQLAAIDWTETEVVTAETAEDAREVLGRQDDIGIIVSDLGLPDSAGLSTVELLLAKAPNVPVIAHTGNVELGRKAVEVGADDYVLKGERERLVYAIRYSVGRARHRADLRSVIDASVDAMVVVAIDTQIVLFANTACAAVLGSKAARLIGERFPFPSEARSVVELQLTVAGEGRTAEMRTTSVMWDGLPAFLCCIRDITDRTRAQEYERRLLISDRLAAIGQLAAGVAHEINNPASFVSVNLEHLRRGFDSLRGEVSSPTEEQQAFIDEMEGMFDDAAEGIRRIASITKDLLSFARIEMDEVEVVEVNELVRMAARMVANEIRHLAALRLDLGNVPKITAHRSKLSQVIVNLLLNASQATEPGAPADNEIVVSTSVVGDKIHIAVRDTGTGIPQHVVDRIFEPFFTTKPRDTGTGLGLSVSLETIRNHEGDIQVETAMGEGTTFTIVLPFDSSRKTPSGDLVLAEPCTGGRILVIDDDAMVRRALLRVIGRGHEVVEAEDGREALEILSKDTAFDIILCDLMMPGVDGPKVYEELPDPALRKRIVFVSGGAFTRHSRDFLLKEQPVVLEKPVSRARLLQLIRSRVESQE